jgi:hypothetical protein
MNADNIKQDVYGWVRDYIEANHEFYNYKFPPCPFARSARLKGLMDIQVWQKGSYYQFAEQSALDMQTATNYTVRILVFPHRMKYHFWMKKQIAALNKKIVAKDLYAQFGSAIKTQSQYPGILEQGPYGIVIINRLSDILNGHQSLLKTDYYKPWSMEHYDAVVTRRQEIANKF